MKYTKTDLLLAMVTIFAVGFFMVFFVGKARADSRHESPDINISIPSFGSDCAVGGREPAADQIKADWHTNKAQWGVGMGYSCSSSGIAAGLAKKYDDILFTGSMGYDDLNKGAIGVGINGRF